MAGYNDTKQLIIDALTGRPVGTEIQPENQQAYELNMLDYIRSIELISTSTLQGIAEATTTPVQPDTSKSCYIAGVNQNETVVFNNFFDNSGNPISITTGEMEGLFVILMWNTSYWTAYTFTTNILSSSETATFYYNYNIKKTYASFAALDADKIAPIGDDGKPIQLGNLVSVVNTVTPSENAFYSRIEGDWQFQGTYNFNVVQVTGTSTTDVMSQDAVTDQLALKLDKTAVKQTTGTSTTDLMSQKAVTDNINTYGVAGGTAQAQTLTIPATIAALTAGMRFTFRPVAANTAAAPTLNINSLGAKTILKGIGASGSTALVANDLLSTIDAIIIYDGTNFRLLNPQSGSIVQATGQSTTDVMSQKAVTDEIEDLELELNTIGSSVIDTGTSDFGVADETGNVIMRLEDGHIKTKNFDSNNVPRNLDSDDSTVDSDFNIGDSNGNVLALFKDGHIKTKNFDSNTSVQDIEFPVFIGKEIDSDDVTLIASNDSLVTPMIRVSKGDVVSAKDFEKIDKICVYEYTYDGSETCNAKSGFISTEYLIQNSNTSFIRIVGVPKVSDVLFIDGVIYGNASFVGNVFILHKTHKTYKDHIKFLCSTIPSGWYVSESSEYSTIPTDVNNPWENTGSELSLKQVYDGLNDLANNYPDYFHLTTLGYDSSDGKTPPNNYGNAFDDWLDGEGKVHIPVYKIELVPNAATVSVGKSRGYNNDTLPTVYLDFGIHPSEQPCMRAMMNFFTHLCRDWQDNDFLSFLRWNCRIVGIPVAVPYSYIDKNSSPTVNGRCNSNGVNINRNFYAGNIWSLMPIDSGGPNYKGINPLTEVETKYILRVLLENADAIAGFSYHTHGVFTNYEDILRIETGISEDNDILNSSGIDTIKGMTLSGWKNHKLPYPLTDGSKYICKLNSHSISGFSSVFRDIVLPTTSPECLYRYYNSGTGAIYNSYTDCMNEEFVANFIINSLRQYFILNK